MLMDHQRKGSFRISLYVLILASIVTFGVAVWPGLPLDESNLLPNYWWVDLVLHGSYYFVLAVILFPLFNYKNPRVWWFFPILFVLSVIFETLQHFLADRPFSILDIIGNMLGISLAALFSYWGKRL